MSMPSPEELRTNEMLALQKLVQTLLEDLIRKGWGTVTIQFSAQNGKVTSARHTIEQVVQIKKAQ